MAAEAVPVRPPGEGPPWELGTSVCCLGLHFSGMLSGAVASAAERPGPMPSGLPWMAHVAKLGAEE